MKRNKINKTLDIAFEYGSIDGSHHKQWLIDQMVRRLLGCPSDAENDEYIMWVQLFEEGKDGPKTYLWDKGIAP